jgi:hypothetical protein
LFPFHPIFLFVYAHLALKETVELIYYFYYYRKRNRQRLPVSFSRKGIARTAMAADFPTTKEVEEGRGVENGGAAAAVVVLEPRVGHHLWRWNINYFLDIPRGESSID